MNIPANLQYTKDHEWVEFTGEGSAKIGLTDFAQDSLGSLVFVNLPEVGDEVTAGDAMSDVESVKAVSDVLSPVTGTVTAVNIDLQDAPENINNAPYDAWLVEVSDISEKAELLDAAAYEAFCAEQ